MVSADLLATNAHVVQSQFGVFLDEIAIVFPSSGAQVALKPIQLVFEDEQLDLAIIRLDVTKPLIPLARDYELKRGDELLIVGNPGVGNDVILKNAISAGIMSSEAKVGGHQFYQIGASVNPGNSGGAALNLEGEAVRIQGL